MAASYEVPARPVARPVAPMVVSLSLAVLLVCVGAVVGGGKLAALISVQPSTAPWVQELLGSPGAGPRVAWPEDDPSLSEHWYREAAQPGLVLLWNQPPFLGGDDDGLDDSDWFDDAPGGGETWDRFGRSEVQQAVFSGRGRVAEPGLRDSRVLRSGARLAAGGSSPLRAGDAAGGAHGAGSLRLVRLVDAVEQWHLRLAEEGFAADAFVADVLADRRSDITLVVVRSQGEQSDTLLRVDAVTGEVLGQSVFGIGALELWGAVGNFWVLRDGDDVVVLRQGDALTEHWRQPADFDMGWPELIGGDFVSLGDRVISVSKGDRVAFGVGMDERTSFVFDPLSQSVFRQRWSDGRQELVRWDPVLDVQAWAASLMVEDVFFVNDEVLVVREESFDGSRLRWLRADDAAQVALQEFDMQGVVDVLSGQTLVFTDGDLVVFDGRGVEQFSVPTAFTESYPESVYTYETQHTFLLDDLYYLGCFDRELGVLYWEVELSDGEYVDRVLHDLVVVDDVQAVMYVLVPSEGEPGV